MVDHTLDPDTAPSDTVSSDILTRVQSTAKVFLTGPFGAGKTTLGVERIRWLLGRERTRGDEILVLVPQRTLAEPYFRALRGPQAPPGPPVAITTFASLAQDAVERYWPLIAPEAGFADPGREPAFLTLETAQYHMAQLVDAAIGQGDFDALRLDRARVISQVIDNLNKAALLGMAIDEVYRRLELAVPLGEQRTARLNALNTAARISHAFRAQCLRETLLDFSLQVQLFNRNVLVNPWSRTHLLRSYRHLVCDNVEEDTPSAHQLVLQWIPQLDSALIVSDSEAGFRTFLGADPRGVGALAAACSDQRTLDRSFIMPPAVARLIPRVERALGQRPAPPPAASLAAPDDNPFADPFAGESAAPGASPAGLGDTSAPGHPDEPATALAMPVPEPAMLREEPLGLYEQRFPAEEPVAAQDDLLASPFAVPDAFRFYPQMLNWAAKEINELVTKQGIAPGNIAVMAPFVSDALRFSLQTALSHYGIELTTHRPSRPLDTEPSARTLFTLAKLAHPHWGLLPVPADVAQCLQVSIPRLDPVRARLLTEIIYPPQRRTFELGTFAALNEAMRSRITYVAGEDYDRLREWLYAYRNAGEELPVDQFFARLFGEVLSQPQYGFHLDRDAARVTSQLVESARKFRWTLDNNPDGPSAAPAPATDGDGAASQVTASQVTASQVNVGAAASRAAPIAPRLSTLSRLGRDYITLAESGAVGALYVPGWRETPNAVFLAPAYTFLLRNRAVDVQFWLDIGASGWWERLYQPLTHPFVLSHRWPANEVWTDADEYRSRQDILRRLLLGLIRRTRHGIYLAVSDYSESGYEQKGALLTLINRLLRQQP